MPEKRPEIPLPNNPRDFKTPNYGLTTIGSLFTDRQLVALNTFSELVHQARTEIEQDALAAGDEDDTVFLRDGGVGAKAYAEAVAVYLSFAVNRLADRGCTICSWDSGYTKIRNAFGRQALPMTWDFTEGNAFSESTGNWSSCVGWTCKVLGAAVAPAIGSVFQHDAQTVEFSENAVISTDPPYYDNIGYADLSDFFFCWMSPALGSTYPDLFGVLATPKVEELVATPYRHGSKEAADDFFLDGMLKAIENMVSAVVQRLPSNYLLRIQAK